MRHPRIVRRVWHKDPIARVLAVAQKQVRRFLTEHLMTLWIPPATLLHLGDDLRAQFPASLKDIANPELRALLEQIDLTPDTTTGSGTGHTKNTQQSARLARSAGDTPQTPVFRTNPAGI